MAEVTEQGRRMPFNQKEEGFVHERAATRIETASQEAINAAATHPNVRAYILEEAKRCVLKDRNTSYGKPEDNFLNTVRLWNEYLQAKGHSVILAPADVAAFMILLKVARLSTNPEHTDSWVDVAGYAACGAECAKK